MGRHRKYNTHLPENVEQHRSSYRFRCNGKWLRLSAVAEGEAKMLRALAKVKDPHYAAQSFGHWVERFKSESPLWKGYAQQTRDDYDLLFPKIIKAFTELTFDEIAPHHIVALRKQWSDTPRTANKVRALVSLIFSFACECEESGVKANPVREVSKLKVKKRTKYVNDGDFYKVRDALMWTTYADGKRAGTRAKVPTGEAMQCGWDLAYLTMQRLAEIFGIDPTTDIVDADENPVSWDHKAGAYLRFEPSKTEHSTDGAVLVPITPQIAAVMDRARASGKVKNPRLLLCNLEGRRYTRWAIAKAVRAARRRAGVADVTFRDLRPKAVTDARRRHGYSLEQVQIAAVHASKTTTEGYDRGIGADVSSVVLPMPQRKTG
jgi:integrase